MDDLVFKQRYKKYKLRVKLWENDFKKKHGRVPSKYDIREASQEIRDSYKMYYKLKTSFLEDTLNEALADDGFDILEISQSTTCGDFSIYDDEGCSSFNGGPQLPIDITAILRTGDNELNVSKPFSNLDELPSSNVLTSTTSSDGDCPLKDFEAVQELKSNQEAWGKNVSKQSLRTKTHQMNDVEIYRQMTSAKPNLNTKLFKSSFSKRNPRKTLSRANSDAPLSQTGSLQEREENSMQQQELPDLETILTQKAKEQQAALGASVSSILVNSENKSQPEIKTQLDEGWLERNTHPKELKDEKEITTKNAKLQTIETKNLALKTYGLSNIDVSKIIPAHPKTEYSKSDSVNLEVLKTPVLEDTVRHADTKPNGSTKMQRKMLKSDSDSFVSGSDGEEKVDKFHQRVKRRRLLPRVDESPGILKPGIENKGLKTLITRSNDVKNRSKVEQNTTSDAKSPEEDFSADENDMDPKYTPEKKTKTTRKKAVPKRAIVSKINIDSVYSKEGLTTSRSKKPKRKFQNNIPDESDEALQCRPPSPGDLKCVLALDGGNITSVPRATLTELELADAVANRYINTTASIPMLSKKLPEQTATVNEKRAAMKRKLEEKIASGKLNENFVRINIEKKRFVRGKKGVNYSKYKKKLWKDKRRVAALTGPDMDMGGCDGGVLKCFTCGQAGHFAQNCKVKGDTLLPLSAQIEEDPSPFPTLEEVAQMASKSAIVVHSRNISKLPEATNSALFYHMDKEERVENATADNLANTDDDDEDEPDNIESREQILMDDDDDDQFMNIDIDVLEVTREISPVKNFVGYKIPEDFLKKAGLDGEDLSNGNPTSNKTKTGILYDLNSDGSVKGVTPEVLEVLHMFGHTSFRKGQDRAIMRILSGLSTLVTLSTGSGKSLCYQLPAYLYSRQKGSITLVVSPLVSLMEDQVTGVPHFLRAHCLHTNQTKPQRLKVMQMIVNGEIDILLVSPEAVVSGERSMGFGSILRQLPPIAFACIDEAHCVSQWSHNFRTSYLMICKVLRNNLGVKTILGLTATATLPTRRSIIKHLGIPDGENGIISDTPLPDNLILSVSKDENRDASLLQLLNSERFEKCQSIIIYCTRQLECERIAGFLRTCLQDRKLTDTTVSQSGDNKKKRKRANWQAEPYHAGMNASRRRVVQNSFMKNELRIVVATIAFGMGINKPDIRAIIHYNMPRNFESYVQEIGRAGRDGKISHCHLFLDAHGNDQNELRRHIYANSIDRHVIRKLLQNVFIPCSCSNNEASTKDNLINETESTKSSDGVVSTIASEQEQMIKRICPGHEIGFSIAATVEALDIPEENISTLLCYMELDSRWNVHVLSSAYMKAKVISYGGPKYLKHAARECPPLAMAIALELKRDTFKEDSNVIEFPVVDIAAAIGWNSGVVKHQLKNLEWSNVNGYTQRSPITVQFIDLGFRVKAPGDFTAEEIDEALDTLYERSVQQEKTQLIQLQYVFQGLSSVAFNSYIPCTKEDFPLDRSQQLKGIIREYFLNDYPKDIKLDDDMESTSDEHIIDDVYGIINMYPDNKFSGRTIARIFHGISSPNYPAVMWGRCKFWRAHSKSDFNRIIQLANSIIIKRGT